MKKIVLFIFMVGVAGVRSDAQVQFKLSKGTDGQTFTVSAISSKTWSSPMNTILSAQVTVTVPSNAQFIAGKITSLVPGAQWIDNAYLESPAADKSNTYVSFYLQTVGSKNFNFEEGVELPLFSFRNIGTGCFGNMQLADNSSSVVKAITASGYNVGQHIGILGAGGEAFSGLSNRSVDCTSNETTAVNNPLGNLSILNAFPIPATDQVTIEYQLSDIQSMKTLSLVVRNILGDEIETIKLIPSTNVQDVAVDVSSYAGGAYRFQLVSDVGVSKSKPFIVIK